MMRMSSANMLSDQNGYAGMAMSWMTALSEARAAPTQRMPLTCAQMPNATPSWMTLSTISTQPQVCSPLMTNLAPPTKKVESETAATPSMKLIVARIANITPANTTQP